jgi:hypothetical protein
MITPPTSCYFVVQLDGEGAADLITSISPGAGADIEQAVMMSADYESDLYALNNLDASIRYIREHTVLSGELTEKFNPLYIPSSIESMDEVLSLDMRHDGVRFAGMLGNPYILKMVEIASDEGTNLLAKIEYRPFELPGYADMVSLKQNTRLN